MNRRRTRVVVTSSEAEHLDHLSACAADMDALYARCAKAYPDFGLSSADFREALTAAVNKYLVGLASGGKMPSVHEIRRFISELQCPDLYLSLACARGNEQAWWHFDEHYRLFIERVARHLVSNPADADEVIDSVYVELFGTKIVDGARQSKFKTYTGRGTLRGWLRTVIWHAVIDAHRARQPEISLEDYQGADDAPREVHAEPHETEDSMLSKLVRERYRSATVAALDKSLAMLDEHEMLLLLYYHVEGLKLREIARIVEEPTSPIRRWFQRQSKRAGRVHESTVMRWLEKVYRKVFDCFRAELQNKHGLKAAEIELCVSVATGDLGQVVSLNLGRQEKKSLSKVGTEASG